MNRMGRIGCWVLTLRLCWTKGEGSRVERNKPKVRGIIHSHDRALCSQSQAQDKVGVARPLFRIDTLHLVGELFLWTLEEGGDTWTGIM